jgi:hypothetical protein
MCTTSSNVENVGHLPSVLDADNIFPPNYSACGLETTYQHSSDRSIITFDDFINFPSPAADLYESSLSSDSLFLEPFVWDGPLKSAAGYSDSSLQVDAPSNDFSWDVSTFSSFIPSEYRKMIREPSMAPTESTSSDTESNTWSASFRQCGFMDSNAATAIHKGSACTKSFSRVLELEKHAKDAKHKPFVCRECKACFSRQDALSRHREIHDSQKLYPCLLCDKYRESAAFRRRDHLRQHLWKKHRVHPNAEFPRHCPYECCGCSEQFKHLAKFDGFGSRREYSKHMREVHGKETHDCDIEGCDRVRSKGFARMNDLQRHRKLVHGRLR